ncbi:hypothetical protein H5410_056597 [Solanum commersonii]|uniref:Uncharacterized protein n=1 Tax=Solanum commersonii TaxID=4109 RepID=A0A9J5WMN2_SOLCO|nr:hypothetical protein H5410_056597 [Solanum commersonii]
MESVVPDGKTDPFSRSNKPQSGRDFCKNFSWTSVKTLDLESVGPDRFSMSFLLNFFVDIRQDLSFRAGCSRHVNQNIFKVKQSPERICNDFLSIFFVDVHQNLSYGAGWSRRVSRPFSM